MEFGKDQRVPIVDLAPADASTLHKRFLELWLRLRGDRMIPAFSDFEPTLAPWALAHIFVVDVLPQDDFVYRIAGSNHAGRYKRNLKGARITDIMQPDGAASILARWRIVQDMPAAFFVVTDHLSREASYVLGERMVLPMGNDGTNPSHQR